MAADPPALVAGAVLLFPPVLVAAFALLVALALTLEAEADVAEVDAADASLVLLDFVIPDALELPELATAELVAEGVPDAEVTDATVLSELSTRYAL